MSVFTEAERAYIASQRVARIATASPTGAPDVAAVRFQLVGDAIDIGGRVNPATIKWHNVVRNGRASVTIDDIASEDPWVVRGIKITGPAETIEREGTTGRILVHPEVVWSWNINEGAETYFADMIEKRVP
ncbi:MAG: PPOX class F420-dependent oxidoreductase [Ilumatobacteraceae bacterium]